LNGAKMPSRKEEEKYSIWIVAYYNLDLYDEDGKLHYRVKIGDEVREGVVEKPEAKRVFVEYARKMLEGKLR